MTERCPACGAHAGDGEVGCQALFEAEGARQITEARLAPFHRLTVDVYAMQHPERCCRSAISLAAHLTGLCAAIDHPRHPSLLRDLQRWLSTRPYLVKPPLPEPGHRGGLTIADIAAVVEPAEYAGTVGRWADDTWLAYRPLHRIARAWVGSVLRD